MRNPHGYATLTWDDGRKQEADTLTCHHCNRIVHIKPLADPAKIGGFCRVCMHLICLDCQLARERGGACTPWEKQMEQIEARDRFLRSVGLLQEVSKNCWIRP